MPLARGHSNHPGTDTPPVPVAPLQGEGQSVMSKLRFILRHAFWPR